ncbi:MAG TPA: class I SAM-dependent methyltransferase, partial [Solirubrobacteraceae bacterium]|nr:class I SAM-dependent methyltransferase [Solirubrobacteraceae bacterium]
EWGDAQALPYEDASFAAATVGFGARNFADLELGLREMARVVRPGGRVVVLEITQPQRPPLSTFFSLWFDRVVPVVGRLAADEQAYSYLPSSVKRFPRPDELAATMQRAGLEDLRWVVTAGGIIALHVGTRRAGAPRAARSRATPRRRWGRSSMLPGPTSRRCWRASRNA